MGRATKTPRRRSARAQHRPAMSASAAHVRDPDSSITPLATSLFERADLLSDDLGARISDRVPFYRPGGLIEPSGLVDSCRDNLEFRFGRWGALGSPAMSAAHRTGARRAAQGAPLSAVIAAFRIGFRLHVGRRPLLEGTAAGVKLEVLRRLPQPAHP